MKKIKPFLKWAGGKFRLTDKINEGMPSGNRLIEPFVGAGAVFLNSNGFNRYLLGDINPDLISLYKIIQKRPKTYITESRKFFCSKYNDKEIYYLLRDQFNQSTDIEERSVLFLYLNRHGYNGLCRYNKKGKFNVPFGRYKKPYFPQIELEAFADKAKQAEFICADFKTVMNKARKGNVVYCDPPYADLGKAAASFTGYAGNLFGEQEQIELAQLAHKLSKKQIKVLISNHDTALTQRIYQQANCIRFPVQRNISRDGNSRKPVLEVLAEFGVNHGRVK